MPKGRVFLSVIVPVFNEERRVFHLEEILEWLSGQKFTWEIVVVDDGSRDRTLPLLEKIKSHTRAGQMQIITYQPNRGKGFAVKTGMLAAVGDWRLFTDIDLSTPLATWRDFEKKLSSFDVIIGVRKPGNLTEIVPQPKWREWLGEGFTLMSKIVLGVNVADFTCGFKCFSKAAAEKVFGQTRVERWGFDSEAMFLVKKMGFSLAEVPVAWRNDRDTKVKLPQDAIRSISELVTIRGIQISGKYRFRS